MSGNGFISELSPYLVEVKAGKTTFWCTCGRSAAQPYCDGSHAGTGLLPLAVKSERDEAVLMCGCKQTGTPPFCDGSHNML